MKKLLVLLLIGMICVFSSNAFAGADWAGEYYLDSLSVTPVGTTDWTTSPAELVVGQTYQVDITAVYDDDNLSDDYPYVGTTTLALSIGAASWTDTASAYGVIYGSGSEENDVDWAYYDFQFDITIEADMLDETYASFLLSGSGCHGNLSQDMGDYDINVSAPIPEPGTIMLLGLGLLSVAGISRRKKA
ncbi:MAG: PEP-CTERM sorting domain-containing protein [Desulfobacter sp.]|nr:MAG: PEP-CTERM sorting domain-containing protein [Desulfobacter sp.]